MADLILLRPVRPPPENHKRVRRAIFVFTFILFLLATGALMIDAFTQGSQDQSHDISTHVANVLLFPMYPLSTLDRLHPIAESVYDCLFVVTWLVTGTFWAALITLSYVALQNRQAS